MNAEISTELDEIIIQQGFTDDLRYAAAELYDAAFGAKLSIAIPATDSRIAILAEGLNPNYAFVAISAGQLVGIAGFKTVQGSLTGNISFRSLQDTLGLLRAVRAALILSLFQRKLAAGQLLMDGIAVSPIMRGHGIGTKLLNRLIAYTRDERYISLRLDVIDTNAAARRLYERIGFTPVKTEYFAYLKWLLGFEAATQMEYYLT